MKQQETAVALGAFDGLHRGHAAVIAKAVAQKENGLVPSVLTFREDPSQSLCGTAEYLLSQEEKESLLAEMGAEKLFVLEFADLRDLSPQRFVTEILGNLCQAKVLVCGTDFRFGKGALGDSALLATLAQRAGMTLVVVPPLEEAGVPISSTRIRAALRAGDAALAASLLGRPFGFSFTVVQGNHIGRTMGTPTINQKLPEGFVRPRFGVYASLVYVEGDRLCGVTNIGVKPTVGQYEPLSETWIPNYDRDMYGENIRVELVEFMRAERKFESLADLRREIHENALRAEAICRARGKA